MTHSVTADQETTGVDAQALPPSGQPCRACGCPVEADDRFCPACGAATGQSVAAAGASSAGSPATPASVAAIPADDRQRGAKYFRCQGCGSEVSVDPDQRSYVCPFCDSSYVVEFSPTDSGRQPPEFVIGFAVTKDVAQEKFRQWLAASGWFRPGDLKRAAVVDRLRGVYLPFWTFAMQANSDWTARIGEHWYRTETYTETDAHGKTVTRTRQVQETEWWDLAGRHHRFYSGYLVTGSRGLSQQEAESIGPFNLPALRRYASYYLAGWACEEYSVSPEAALERCQQEFYRREQSNVASFLPGDTHADLKVNTRFRDITSDLCLLPVHVLTYKYGGKVFRFLVNGQTGRVTGERPLSWLRVCVAIGIVVGIVALVVAAVAALQAMGR